MKPAEAVRAEFAAVPAMRHFAMELVSWEDGAATLTLPVSAEYHQLGGVVHGGIITTLADTAAVYAIWPGLDDDRMMTSIEFKLNFLRPVSGDAGPLRARATAVTRGRRVAVSDVEVSQADRPVARGLFTYLLFDRD